WASGFCTLLDSSEHRPPLAMNGRPRWQSPWAERYFVPLSEYNGLLHYVLVVTYLVLATQPQIMHTVGVGGPSHGWPQWVGLLVAIVLAICAATDYFARTITQRTVLVLLGIAAFWGLMRPLMLICGRILNIDGPLVSPGMRIFAWS